MISENDQVNGFMLQYLQRGNAVRCSEGRKAAAGQDTAEKLLELRIVLGNQYLEHKHPSIFIVS